MTRRRQQRPPEEEERKGVTNPEEVKERWSAPAREDELPPPQFGEDPGTLDPEPNSR